MMTKWAAPLALTRGLLSGLCLCWRSYTSLEGTERGPSQDRTLTPDVVEAIRLGAEEGDASAQFTLGQLYHEGLASRKTGARRCGGTVWPLSRGWQTHSSTLG